MTVTSSTARLALTGVFVAGLGHAAAAATTTTVLRNPDNFANPSEGEVPAQTDDTGTIGAGSWQADPSIDDDGSDAEQHLIFLQGGLPGPLAGGPKSYPAAGANPNLLFPASQAVEVGDVTSISFDTDVKGDSWFVDIFTRSSSNEDSTEGNDGSFYQTNLDLVTNNLAQSGAPNGFDTYSFDATGGGALQDLGGSFNGPFDFQEVDNMFGSEEIRFLALGTNSINEDFAGRVDNFVFEYDFGGESFTRTIDLEQPRGAMAPVPVPAGLPLLATAAGLLGWVGRRRKS